MTAITAYVRRSSMFSQSFSHKSTLLTFCINCQRWLVIIHIPLSCSQKHSALDLNGSHFVSQTYPLHKAKQYGLTARITLAKLRSLHTAAIQSLQTMAILSWTIATLSHTSVSWILSFRTALTNLSGISCTNNITRMYIWWLRLDKDIEESVHDC